MPKHASQFALFTALAGAGGAEQNEISIVPLLVQLRRMDIASKVHWRNWLFVEIKPWPQMSIVAIVSEPTSIKIVEGVGVDLLLNGQLAFGERGIGVTHSKGAISVEYFRVSFGADFRFTSFRPGAAIHLCSPLVIQTNFTSQTWNPTWKQLLAAQLPRRVKLRRTELDVCDTVRFP